MAAPVPGHDHHIVDLTKHGRYEAPAYLVREADRHFFDSELAARIAQAYAGGEDPTFADPRYWIASCHRATLLVIFADMYEGELQESYDAAYGADEEAVNRT